MIVPSITQRAITSGILIGGRRGFVTSTSGRVVISSGRSSVTQGGGESDATAPQAGRADDGDGAYAVSVGVVVRRAGAQQQRRHRQRHRTPHAGHGSGGVTHVLLQLVA